ncbi:DEAD/DEAH box helicase [Streptomyces iconiensis]|uniref:DEAD/DEAH box helicase n=1 Tax=Streptomyces iconiensis TaxID=1384038 RepID=A0ABT7A6Z3_9ACTN|nr:DEAD/DEAH box helicase [Streptomyces iconiensis]MDJ1137118.1 DEAD/DEAH box helicase [Streptomyces iconiensis]
MSKRQPDQAGNRADQARGPQERQISGGMPRHPDDEELARMTEAERVDAGVDDYNPDEVPPATDTEPSQRVTDSGQYAEERAEVDRELGEGELDPDQLAARRDREAFPPTRYS